MNKHIGNKRKMATGFCLGRRLSGHESPIQSPNWRMTLHGLQNDLSLKEITTQALEAFLSAK
jgi:hypothetical protein